MVSFTPEKIAAYYAPQGLLHEVVADYKYRSEQADLAAAIAEAFLEDRFLVAEVGTGVGKTLAYLLPAIEWAKTQHEKVVITTKTRALQQQIIEKDIPDLIRALDMDITCVEAKGRDNYVCWNKYIEILAGKKALSAEEQEFMTAVLKWVETTRTGDKKELTLKNSLLRHWHLLAGDRRTCMRNKCRFHDKCFRLKMIKSLEKADLIITNHAMLLSDILVDNSILPEYQYLVVDEAHALEKESFDKLSLSCPRQEITEVLKVLEFHDKGFRRGYLRQLKRKNQQLAIDESLALTDRTADLAEQFYRQLSVGIKTNDSYSLVLTDELMEEAWFQKAWDLYSDWHEQLRLLIKSLQDLSREVEEEEEPELFNIIAVLEEVFDSAYCIMEEDLGSEAKIVWLETEQEQAIGICSSHVRIGEVLENKLYDKLSSLIMLSATLSIEDKFDYFIEKVGLSEYLAAERLDLLLKKSPFDYQNQACLYIINDMPDPQHLDFSPTVARVLMDLLTVARGRTMVLFTARKGLREVSQLLRPFCKQKGIPLLVQNEDGSFGTLMEEYARENNAVLMGLDTFWEGVDLKGDLLTLLVVVKLPFRSLAEPYSSAGDKYFRLQHRNSFSNFLLPDAAVRFKQGVGRLIRSETDRGIVVVLDNRLSAKAYGKVFLNSIPIKNTIQTRSDELLPLIEDWL
ncbi:MAG TPA: helicase C-terminal domain-containing protein [Syntrophomonadaceae bacterium]|nr:helicase C-terminal domain-containing protein [Syntrophomonadaceae bacterium]HRX21810.1 helicase C-terminal domain-containing protein [Syntrophomonadaceae bacterium]